MLCLQFALVILFLISSPSYGQSVVTVWIAPNSPASKAPDVSSGTDMKHKYLFSLPDQKANWYNARESCERFGLEFASVTSASELEEFKVAFKATVGRDIPDTTKSNFWLGGNDLATRGRFSWATTPPQKFLYTYWMSGQPDNSNWSGSEGERCLLSNAGTDYFWNDYPCNKAFQYACKISI